MKTLFKKLRSNMEILSVFDISEDKNQYPYLNSLVSCMYYKLGINPAFIRHFEICRKYDRQIDSIKIVFRPNSFQYEGASEDTLHKYAKYLTNELKSVINICAFYDLLDKQWYLDFKDKLNELSIDEDREDTK